MPEINKLEHNWIIKKIDSETVNIQVTNNDILITIFPLNEQEIIRYSKKEKLF